MRRTPLFAIPAAFLLAASPGAAAGPPALEFAPVPLPATDAAMRGVVATSSVRIAGGPPAAIGFHLLARGGDRLGDGVFGLLLDRNGRPMVTRDGAERISTRADFTSLLPAGERLFSITHFESVPGAMYLSELARDETGLPRPVSTRSIDFANLGGLWAPCAGSVTPWGSHLGSEEYPPSARRFEAAREPADLDGPVKAMARYLGLDPETTSVERLRGQFNPYAYGYPVEVAVDARGGAHPVKHFAMGRVSVELAYVMPDRRSVYITDDTTNGGLFLFVADKADDLGAGSLYAAKWRQTSDRDGGAAELAWIALGPASDLGVASLVKAGIGHSDIFETAAGDPAFGSCPVGFGPVDAGGEGFQCLKLKSGMAMAASRLETRALAGLRGATTEFNKMEGITFDPASRRLFLALSSVGHGMGPSGHGGPDDISLPANPCGAVYALEVGTEAAIGSDYVATSMRAELAGRPAAGGACDPEGIANPDNLTFIAGHGTLIIAEDTQTGHRNDAIWAYDVATRRLTRILTTPYGAEATAVHWYPDIGGQGYLTAVIQHPFGESDRELLKDPSEARAYVGYIGPFPAMAK